MHIHDSITRQFFLGMSREPENQKRAEKVKQKRREKKKRKS